MKPKLSNVLLISSCLTYLCSTGCQPKPIDAHKSQIPVIHPLKIAVSTDLLADSVKSICRERCEVTTLIPSTANPHNYKFTEQNLDTINYVDLVIYVGYGFESNCIEAIRSSNTKAISLEETTSKIQVRSFNGKRDPHIWNDPFFWSLAQEGIAKIISSNKPELAEVLTKNHTSYSHELVALGKEVSRTLSSIPEKNRILVTNHDSLEYFASKYTFQPFAIYELTPSSEVSKMKFDYFVSMIVERKVPVIFVESGIDSSKIRELQKAVRAKGWQVRIGGELTTDSLGKYDSYINMIRGNAKIIADGLKQ